jgi:hypothetical protein
LKHLLDKSASWCVKLNQAFELIAAEELFMARPERVVAIATTNPVAGVGRSRAGVPRPVADHLEASARSIAQGVVPMPRAASATTARAVTRGSLDAFAGGLETALVAGAVIVLVTGLSAFLLLGPRVRREATA